MRLIVPDRTGHTELATPDTSVEAILKEAEGYLQQGRHLLVEEPGKESRYVRDAQDLPSIPETATVYAFRPLAGGVGVAEEAAEPTARTLRQRTALEELLRALGYGQRDPSVEALRAAQQRQQQLAQQWYGLGLCSLSTAAFQAHLAASVPTTPPPSSAAEKKAYALLEEAIGAGPAAHLDAGGGYEIPARRMVGRLKRRSFLVPRTGRIVILEDGLPVGESCLVADPSLPWADQALHRIKAIQADETVAFTTGILTMWARGRHRT